MASYRTSFFHTAKPSRLSSQLDFYKALGWKVVYGPVHFDAIEGLSFPMWVVTS